MIDHITISVSDLEQSKRFYELVFAPLGYVVSFGEDGIFWVFDVDNGLFEIMQAQGDAPLTKVHVAFRVKSRSEVDAFYEAALAAGAKDNGQPGPRPNYTEHYYAAFVHDPDGYNIEAMIDQELEATDA